MRMHIFEEKTNKNPNWKQKDKNQLRTQIHRRVIIKIGLLMSDLVKSGVFRPLKIALKFINHEKYIGQPSQEIFCI